MPTDTKDEKDLSIRQAMAQTTALAGDLKASVDDLLVALEEHVNATLSTKEA